MNDTKNHDAQKHPLMPPHVFAKLGGDQLAYVRPVASEDLATMFPDAPEVAPGLKLWALLAADGSPILIADSRDAAVANAMSNDIHAVSVH
ncbi:hypothetical protein GGD81_002503 [Rhodobium orientis]|nr:hypothetical protein [Rhodobium orientis]